MHLYLYEHCPYCVRVRLLADFKKLNIPITILANDDIENHLNKVNQKIVPILQKEDESYMLESMDICHYLDQMDGNSILKISLSNPSFMQTLEKVNHIARYLTHPRQPLHPLNQPDFPTSSAIQYFQTKKEKSLGLTFKEALIKTPTYIQQITPALEALDIYIPETLEGITTNDILLFPSLRALTIAADALTLSPKTEHYLAYFLRHTNIQRYPHHTYTYA